MYWSWPCCLLARGLRKHWVRIPSCVSQISFSVLYPGCCSDIGQKRSCSLCLFFAAACFALFSSSYNMLGSDSTPISDRCTKHGSGFI
uniref:Uncharacterized protein n=1 Tax=Arundo donax TaxID=35708 RepID=A0A0A9DXJ3_ARUDO